MDAALLFSLALEVAAQTPVADVPVAPIVQQAPAKLTTIAGLTTLEIILMSTCGTLAGVITTLWIWGNGIRKENALKFDELSKAQQKVLVDNTADNKDIVHALQDVGKTMDDVAKRLERIERARNGAA